MASVIVAYMEGVRKQIYKITKSYLYAMKPRERNVWQKCQKCVAEMCGPEKDLWVCESVIALTRAVGLKNL